MTKPTAKLIGTDGNIFALMGKASRALKKADQRDKADELLRRIPEEAKSYDQALQIIMEYVEVE